MPLDECYCSPQEALAACMCLPEVTEVEPYGLPVDPVTPWARIDSIGDGPSSNRYKSSVSTEFYRVYVHGRTMQETILIARKLRQAARCCEGKTLTGNVGGVSVGGIRVESPRDNECDYVANFRVTLKTNRSESCPAKT